MGLTKGLILMGASWLNLGSLALGLIAWILPVVNLMRRNKTDHRHWAVLSITSVSACAVSLCMQLFYTDHLVKIEDWSALMDTSSAVAMVSTLLLVVTILLNTIGFFLFYGKKSHD
jgi:cytochrome c oxidase subunit 4